MDEQARRTLLNELEDRAAVLRNAIEESGAPHTPQAAFVRGQLDGVIRAALLLGIDRDLLRGYLAELTELTADGD
jgi:hypothetical protein